MPPGTLRLRYHCEPRVERTPAIAQYLAGHNQEWRFHGIRRIDSHGSLRHSGSRMQSDGLQAPCNFRVGRCDANGNILVSAIDIFWTV